MRAWLLQWWGPPPPNQNGSVSRWRTAALRKTWRENALVLARRAGLPQREIIRYRVSGYMIRRALLVADPDGDGSRFKSVIDGLVAAKYLPDDTRRYVEWTPIDEQRGPPGFVLRIEELPYDEDTRQRALKRYARDDERSPLEQVRRAHRRRRQPAALFPTSAPAHDC